MPDETVVDYLYADAKAVIDALKRTPELSLRISVEDHFRKVLLLAAASYFERRVTESVLRFVEERSAGSVLVLNFVRNKAVERQYHTWFSWGEASANSFFGLFGADFRSQMSDTVKGSEPLRLAVRSFLSLGDERNKLVHQDYATFPLDKTLDEVYAQYCNALPFVEGLPGFLRAGQPTSTGGAFPGS